MKSALIAAALSTLAVAAPTADARLAKRDNIDGVVLNFALTLENLEASFYRQALNRFTTAQLSQAGFSSALAQKQIRQVAKHERQHVAILSAALKAAGANPAKECSYNFDSAFASPAAFALTASIFEDLGTAAYAGAAQLITNKQYLTQAAAILGVEAQHTAFLRQTIGRAPSPQTLTSALTPNQVWTIVTQFLRSCPSGNPNLQVSAYKQATNRAAAGTVLQRGDQARIAIENGVNVNRDLWCAWLAPSGNIFSKVFNDGGNNVRCVIPKGEFAPMGQAYVVIVSSTGSVTDANTVAGTAVFEVKPPFTN